MDPLAQAMQLLAEAQQTIQILAEEVQLTRQGKKDQQIGVKKEICKTASEFELSEIFGTDPQKLPDFIKEATISEAKELYRLVEENINFSKFGKVAEFQDGNSFSDPGEALEARLSSLIS